jgi:hypothetical protein
MWAKSTSPFVIDTRNVANQRAPIESRLQMIGKFPTAVAKKYIQLTDAD